MITPDAYRRWRLTALGRVTEVLEMGLVFELAGSLRDRRVLDIGTGDGSYALGACARGARAAGIDPDEQMLAAARHRSPARSSGVAFVRASAEAIPFPAACFDVVLSVTVLCFVSDVWRSVLEMSRVLAPGGRLVIGELARWSPWAAGRWVRGRLGDRTWRHARFWSRRALRELVGSAGLHVDAVRGAIHYPPAPLAARAFGAADHLLGRLGAPGAAFLAVSAHKPEGSP